MKCYIREYVAGISSSYPITEGKEAIKIQDIVINP
ncbi:hypothetical protein FHU23_000416 [Clostridium saccharobutylicum]|nr:hypothetical protein [Clostridium saccharobutylicum]MBA8788394.1 hypothetical protein [Clostridium saccharobutylicum]MBA8895075.1 hypothetical protein [Clostridium saccharobutylicum]MBA8984018.1 hypothetical protein [Clostridium saccharobutylicum]MBA8992212.1 hypothetical protein [Clostridium saccharobutylicum]